jgi:folate-dependent phosphoribosylglycinamide formyltransferase PurN
LKEKILIISGDLLKHKFTAIKVLKKFKNSKIIFEKYPKKIFKNYTKKTSKVIKEHFYNVEKYENLYFKKYVNANKKILQNRVLLTVNRGKINTKKIYNLLIEENPKIILINATSKINENIVNKFKNKIINIHAGLTPYYKGAGCNVWTFYYKELKYTGVTIHFVNSKIDSGKIITQQQSKFQKKDNTHTIGCKNAILGSKLAIKAILFLLKNNSYLGSCLNVRKKDIKTCFKKDFNASVVKIVNLNIAQGVVKDYFQKPQKVKLIAI